MVNEPLKPQFNVPQKPMEKLLKIADLRYLEGQLSKGEISYSRMVEIINEKHFLELVNLRTELHDKIKNSSSSLAEKEARIAELENQVLKMREAVCFFLNQEGFVNKRNVPPVSYLFKLNIDENDFWQLTKKEGEEA